MGKEIILDSKYEYTIRAMLRMIRSEIERLHWNKKQCLLELPFENNGTPDFVTDTFTVRSYNWDENIKPNFETKNLKVWWYKHSDRGVYAKSIGECDINKLLIDTLNESLETLYKMYGEK